MQTLNGTIIDITPVVHGGNTTYLITLLKNKGASSGMSARPVQDVLYAAIFRHTADLKGLSNLNVKIALLRPGQVVAVTVHCDDVPLAGEVDSSLLIAISDIVLLNGAANEAEKFCTKY